MYEIREGMKQINGVIVDTFERDIRFGDTSMEAEAGTTGFCGGDRSEGGRAYIRISGPLADFFCRKTEDGSGVEIAVSGDEEILSLLTALHFIQRALCEQISGEDE